MPVALETSKRKFHRLLDSLTSGSSERPATPDSSVVATTEGATKRLRLTPRSRLAASHPLVNSSTNLRAIRRVPSAAVGIAAGTLPKGKDNLPNYVPWSRDQFQKRLKTFANVGLWSSKPDPINEVAWAKRGWICESKNRVACKGGCEERIVLSLRPRLKDGDGKDIDGTEDTAVEISDELVRRYSTLIVEGHKDDCLWRGAGCGDDIMRMPLARPSIWQPGLKERYLSFVDISGSLPALDKTTYPCDLDGLAVQLGRDFFDNGAAIDKTALAFAILGWQAPKDFGRDSFSTAACSECFRRLGLWLYSPRPPTASSNYSKGAPSLGNSVSQSSRSKANDTVSQVDDENDVDKLDLAASHRDYCPWVNADSQATPGPLRDLAGWQILQKVVGNWSGLKARALKAQQRSHANDAPDTNEDRRDDDGATLDEEFAESFADSAKSREETRKQDNARFARLRELRRMMGLKPSREKADSN